MKSTSCPAPCKVGEGGGEQSTKEADAGGGKLDVLFAVMVS